MLNVNDIRKLLIIAAGITKIIYNNIYDRDNTIKFLEQNNIEVIKYEEK